MDVKAARYDTPRLLLVGADPQGTGRLEPAVIAESWQVHTVGTGAAARPAAATFGPHLAVIEMRLPDLDGVEVMRALRGDHPRLPVLFLVGLNRAEVRVAALTAGGDDCVSTPFHLPELLSRLRALLRRRRMTVQPSTSIVVGDLTLHEPSHRAWRAGHPIDLTLSEFELLRQLMTNPGRVLSREAIRTQLWTLDHAVTARMIHQHIARLRRKLEAHGPQIIRTVRGLGYVLDHRHS
jgi:two-component system, OmpR family, response regulator